MSSRNSSIPSWYMHNNDQGPGMSIEHAWSQQKITVLFISIRKIISKKLVGDFRDGLQKHMCGNMKASSARSLVSQNMPRHTVSEDLKTFIPALHHDGYKIQQICDILTVKKSLIYKTLALFSNCGVVSNPHKYSHISGHPRSRSQADLNFVQATVDHRPTIYLNELQQELFSKCGVQVSISTLTRAVKWLHITHKIVTAPALERNEVLRALYMNRVSAEVPDVNMLLLSMSLPRMSGHHSANMVELERARHVFSASASSEASTAPYFPFSYSTASLHMTSLKALSQASISYNSSKITLYVSL
jgi:transposase